MLSGLNEFPAQYVMRRWQKGLLLNMCQRVPGRQYVIKVDRIKKTILYVRIVSYYILIVDIADIAG